MTWLLSLVGLPLIGTPLIYGVGHLARIPRVLSARWLALLLLALEGIALAVVAREIAAVQSVTYTLGAITLRMEGLSLLLSTLAVLLGALVVIFSAEDIAGEIGEEKYYAMIVILTGTMIGLSCAGDIFNLWVWFEGMAIASYLLIAFYRQRVSALAACVKYFMQTVSGSILILFGIALVLIQTGSLDLAALSAQPSPILLVAGALFLIGFGVKAALFPNYLWLPDAYAESPTGISALLSGVVTSAGLIALLKALAPVVWSSEAWGNVLMVIGVINIVVGNLPALVQTEVKRVLAFSSISHIGYIVLAIGIGVSTQSLPGMRGATLHLFVHGLMKALAFLAVGAFAFARWTSTHDEAPLVIRDLNGAARRYPGMALALTIALLSLTGVPLLAGFVSKWQILIAGLASGSGLIVGLIIFAALNTALSVAYYLRIINALYGMSGESRWAEAPALPLAIRLPVIALAILIVVFGVLPSLMDGLVDPAAGALLALFTHGG